MSLSGFVSSCCFFEFVVNRNDDLNFIGLQSLGQRRQAGQGFEHGQCVLVEHRVTAGPVEMDAEQLPLARHFQTQPDLTLPATHGGDARVFLLAGKQLAKPAAVAVEQFAFGADGYRWGR